MVISRIVPAAAVGQGARDRIEDRREDRGNPCDQAEVRDLRRRVDALDLKGERDAGDADVERVHRGVADEQQRQQAASGRGSETVPVRGEEEAAVPSWAANAK
ncbi:hypothetical protein [Streptomyces sp. NBC_00091]|uniref:hypothetical protein n=1 Tax=Streptomyces sp. NBC_00091 TaxID=2975648 RepID=UPI0022599D23|nr:hypothetical protein [Streptomyces sp. NBC_00091]MCX5380882.1 hypothetical protein [Streptomyces sp. NBC_00091]